MLEVLLPREKTGRLRPSQPGLLSCLRTFWMAFALFGFVATSCGEIGEPNLGAGPIEPETSPLLANEDAKSEEAIGDEGVTPVDGAPQLISSPARPDGYIPSLVIATAETGLFMLDFPADDPVDLVALNMREEAISVTGVVDDFFGGLVVQEKLDGDDALQWFRLGGVDPVTLATGTGRLLDVGFIDAGLAAYAFVAVAGETVDRISLIDGQRASFASLDPGQQLLDLSTSNGLHALAIADDACGDLLFWNSTGKLVDLGGPPVPLCEVARRPSYGAVALSPDGTRVAFTALSYRSDGVVAATELTVSELDSDAVVFSILAGGPGQTISSLSFDGTRLAYIRSDSEVVEVVVVSVDEGADETVIPTPSPALDLVFARQPVTVGR